MDDEILDPLLLPSSPGSTVSQLTNDTGLLRPEDDVCLGIQLPNEPPGYGSPIPISSLDELPHRLSTLGSEAEADTASTITAPMHMGMERSVSGGIILAGALTISPGTTPQEERVSTSLPSPRSTVHSPSFGMRDGGSGAAHVPHRHTHREVAAPHHTVHGFHPAVVLPHRPSIPPLRRTGSTGRGVSHLAPLAPMRPTSTDRPRKPQPLAGHAARHKDRFVTLSEAQPHIPEEEPEDLLQSTEDESEGGALVVTIGDTFYRRAKNWGRIAVYCMADSFHRDAVEQQLHQELPACDYSVYPETIYVSTTFSASEVLSGDMFLMDYGVVIFWNLTTEQEQEMVRLLRPCAVKPMPEREVLVNTLSFHYSSHEPPHIQDDVIHLNKRQASDCRVKLAISYALAQSSMLTLYEDRIASLVAEVRHLPETLAKYGKVQMSRRQVAKLMGKVFLQKSAVNLLSTVLDTPEWLWSQPDYLQVLYDKVCEYLELEERVELVNSRFEIIQKMLHIWSEHSQRTHLSRLDMIIVLLILLEVVLAAAQVVGMLWW